jgi:hypothetical protein
MRQVFWVALGVMLAGPARADDYVTFQSPSGNIHCAIYQWEDSAEARCDLMELVPSDLPQPEDCELDWGQAFAVAKMGRAGLACVGDTVTDPENDVLIYGEAVSLGGLSCVSAKTGMTCTNAEGHGFTVSKSKQELF